MSTNTDGSQDSYSSMDPPAEFPTQRHADHESRFELFILGPGEKKVTWEHDTRKWTSVTLSDTRGNGGADLNARTAGVPNTAIFTFNKEDHTLGNLLAQRLHKYKYIKFSGYQVPHPLFAKFLLRVSTDGTITPKDAVIQACRDVVQDLEVFSREFTKEMELKKIAKAGGDA